MYVRVCRSMWIIHLLIILCLYHSTESSDSCSYEALGIEDGTIPSDHLTASSEFSNAFKANRGRLNTIADDGGKGCWAAASNDDQNPWIQADLGVVKGVIGVITQGRSDGNQWVTSYEVHHSVDGNNFEPILETSGQVKTFDGNLDQNTDVTNIFSYVVFAQFIRINPKSWKNHVSLRFELLSPTDPLDITFYSPLASNQNEFRGYALQNSKTTDITIGILYKDMNGKDNVTWADTEHSGDITDTISETLKDMPDDKIFDTSGEIQYRVYSDFVYLGVSLPNLEGVGVFSFEAKHCEVVSRSAIVLTSSSATIRMQFRTLTVGIGESVTIHLSKGTNDNNLRWRHNYGDAIQMWNGNSSVTIENIRAKDDGVYECYTGDSPDGNHGIMRLIVRGCPLPKWNPPECEKNCPVCYNGGVCDHMTGLCICPAGFNETNCERACGSNDWGRNCDVVCETGMDEACKGQLFCPPDPFGCTCIDGYGGDDCNTACTGSQYGADCRQPCHCDSCNSKTGCGSGPTCWDNYTGPGCQELESHLDCPTGFFGVLCNFPCHCKDPVDCNRDGSCINGCHEAWAGPKCSIALPYRSGPPTLLNQTATTLTIDASWVTGQDFGTGTITRWTLWYKTLEANIFTSIITTDNDVFTIDNLLLHTTVQFYTQHSRLVGGEETDGPPSEHGSAVTICKKPLEEPEIELKTVEGKEIILKLEPVSNATEQIQCDDILRYQVRYRSIDGNEQDIVNTTDGSQTEVKISGLSECVEYDVDSRVVNNEDIVGDWGEYIRVQAGLPAPSTNTNSVVEETSLLMKWNAVTCDNTDGQVIYYYQLSGGIIQQGNTTDTQVLFTDGIQPCTQYTFTVLASHLNVNGTTYNEVVTSAVDYPGKPSITSLNPTSSSITLEWTAPDDNMCMILEYNVLVSSDLKNFDMTTEETSLTITEDIISNTYYSVQVAARTHKGYGNFSDLRNVSTNADNSGETVSAVESNGAVIGGVTGSLSVAIIAIVLVLIFIKRRGNSNKEVNRRPNVQHKSVKEGVMMAPVDSTVDVRSLDDDVGASPYENECANTEPVYANTHLGNHEYKPIELARLHDYVLKRNMSLENGFKKEFEDLGDKPLYPWTVAKDSKNRTKNRYANVIPYDNSRVVLDLFDSIPGSDYINASYLDGYTTPREFIACQGPNTASVNDMWRMIWQEKSTIVVVVTNVFEGTKRKCEQYWPELNNGMIYANISVTNAEETNYGHYVIRNLQVQKVGTNEVHSVFQYHFTEWPDKSVPRVIPQLIDFIYTIKTAHQNSPSSSGPVIVHCSAGAGRTGTVIAIAAMLDMSKQEGKVDVFNFVRSMREKRIQMVQTEEQYEFIYAVLLEELFCGQTVIPVADIHQVMHEQKQVHGRPSTLEYQLKTLNSLSPRPADDLTSHARLPVNILKNRFSDVLPLNKARPFLMSPCDTGNDYINASFCDSYGKRNAFIVTQAPLADPIDTSIDFWCLVFDYESDVIVQLNGMEDTTCAKYLPQRVNQQVKFGIFSIKIKSTEQKDFMIERKLMLQKDKKVREILHLEFRQWPNKEPVPKVDSFVRFIAAVERGHNPSSDRPIIIHCLDGISRSGLFCSVYAMINKIKEDKMVDVFQTVKTLRSVCPTMVNSKVQYAFCYDSALCYLDGFEDYVNL